MFSIVQLLSVGGGSTIQVNYLVLGKCISFLPQSIPSLIFIDGRIHRGWQLQLFSGISTSRWPAISSQIWRRLAVTVMKFCHSVADLQLITSFTRDLIYSTVMFANLT